MKQFNGSEKNPVSISVVMPTRNSELTICKCLDALVLCKDVTEILIADGNSEDRTLALISEFDSAKVKVISSRDKGLYDGVNKLIPYITGQYVFFMNSDDIVNSDYVHSAVSVLGDRTYDYVFGDIVYDNFVRKPRFEAPPKTFRPFQLMPFPHVSLIMDADLFRKVGGFDLRYKIAADLDYINRLMSLTNRGKYLPIIAAVCSPNGLSSGNEHVYEAWQVAVRHGRNPIAASLTALAVYVYRCFFLPAKRMIRVRNCQIQ